MFCFMAPCYDNCLAIFVYLLSTNENLERMKTGDAVYTYYISINYDKEHEIVLSFYPHFMFGEPANFVAL